MPKSAPPIVGQLARYGVVGVANSLIGFAIYAAAVKLGGVQYLLASTVAYAIGGINGYVLNHRWTFATGASHLTSAPRYAAVQVGALLGNLVLLYGLVHVLGVEKIIAQAIVVAIVFLATFVANRLWSFAHRSTAELAPR